MALTHCTDHNKAHGDANMLCFVNRDGKHVSPKDCLCRYFHPQAQDRLKTLPDFAHLASMERYKYVKSVTAKDYKKVMKAKYGKENPQCPIEDAHDPLG